MDMVKPISLADTLEQWGRINAGQQAATINALSARQALDQAPIQAKLQEAQLNRYTQKNELENTTALEKKAALFSNVSKLVVSRAEAQAKQLGISEGTPEYQDIYNKTAQPLYPLMSQAFGHQINPNDPVDINALKTFSQVDSSGGIDEHKIPTGFMPDGKGGIVPMQVDGYGNYADYQMQLATGKAASVKQIPGYGQQEQLANDAERLRLAQQAADRAEKSAENAKLQTIPATHRMVFSENGVAMSQIDKAIQEAEKNPSAFGLQNYAGEAVNQRLDPDGVDARAKVANIGGVKLHDLSGAAVSVGEAPRLMPLIPTATDDSKAVVTKLKNLRKEYEEMNRKLQEMYSTPDYRNPLKSTEETPTEETPKIEETKEIDGIIYHKINGEWHNE